MQCSNMANHVGVCACATASPSSSEIEPALQPRHAGYVFSEYSCSRVLLYAVPYVHVLPVFITACPEQLTYGCGMLLHICNWATTVNWRYYFNVDVVVLLVILFCSYRSHTYACLHNFNDMHQSQPSCNLPHE